MSSPSPPTTIQNIARQRNLFKQDTMRHNDTWSGRLHDDGNSSADCSKCWALEFLHRFTSQAFSRCSFWVEIDPREGAQWSETKGFKLTHLLWRQACTSRSIKAMQFMRNSSLQNVERNRQHDTWERIMIYGFSFTFLSDFSIQYWARSEAYALVKPALFCGSLPYGWRSN